MSSVCNKRHSVRCRYNYVLCTTDSAKQPMLSYCIQPIKIHSTTGGHNTKYSVRTRDHAALNFMLLLPPLTSIAVLGMDNARYRTPLFAHAPKSVGPVSIAA